MRGLAGVGSLVRRYAGLPRALRYLRAMEDVLESHRCVGVFDPSLWWLVFDREHRAMACLLLSACPEQDSVELVYLGLARSAREGLGSKLLSFGLRRLYDGPLAAVPTAGRTGIAGTGGVTCAVDSRNASAVKLYRRAGFEKFGVRVPYVRSLRPARALDFTGILGARWTFPQGCPHGVRGGRRAWESFPIANSLFFPHLRVWKVS